VCRVPPRSLFALLLVWPTLATPAENWKPVKGEALKTLIAGREFGDSAHFSYRFSLDGKFSGVELGKDVRGLWRVNGDELCWKWTRPPGAEECYEVQKDGAATRLMLNGSEARYGKFQ
jgi:hypothetical protein